MPSGHDGGLMYIQPTPLGLHGTSWAEAIAAQDCYRHRSVSFPFPAATKGDTFTDGSVFIPGSVSSQGEFRPPARCCPEPFMLGDAPTADEVFIKRAKGENTGTTRLENATIQLARRFTYTPTAGRSEGWPRC